MNRVDSARFFLFVMAINFQLFPLKTGMDMNTQTINRYPALSALVTLLLTAAIVISPQRVCAQPETHSVSFFLGGSGSASLGKIADEASTAFGGIAGISFRLWLKSAPEITLRAIGSFDSFGGNNPSLSDFEFIRGGLDLRFAFTNAQNRPIYLLMGAGFAHVSVDRSDSSGGSVIRFRDNSAYISPGLGMELTYSGSIRFFAEVRFTNIDGKSVRDYQFWTLTAGLSF